MHLKQRDASYMPGPHAAREYLRKVGEREYQYRRRLIDILMAVFTSVNFICSGILFAIIKYVQLGWSDKMSCLTLAITLLLSSALITAAGFFDED